MLSFTTVLVVLCGFCYSAKAATLSKAFPLSAAAKQYTLDLHNTFRSNIAQGKVANQPTASNMLSLVWDTQLEAKAKAWSEKCAFNHSDGTKSGLSWYWVGENLAVGTLMGEMKSEDDVKAQLKNGFDMWAGEAAQFTYPKTCKKVCGHYTQLAWAKTTSVGCGIAQCNGMGGWDIGNKLAYLMVCNYGPGGNFNNEDPYTKGASCSACPKEASKCSANKLCSK